MVKTLALSALLVAVAGSAVHADTIVVGDGMLPGSYTQRFHAGYVSATSSYRAYSHIYEENPWNSVYQAVPNAYYYNWGANFYSGMGSFAMHHDGHGNYSLSLSSQSFGGGPFSIAINWQDTQSNYNRIRLETALHFREWGGYEGLSYLDNIQFSSPGNSVINLGSSILQAPNPSSSAILDIVSTGALHTTEWTLSGRTSLGFLRGFIIRGYDGPGPTPQSLLVPLPPAAWAGISTLAGVGFVGAIRRRRQQA